jgi:S-methylmethionine-dependent homocysteine/selenocysteine methylase
MADQYKISPNWSVNTAVSFSQQLSNAAKCTISATQRLPGANPLISQKATNHCAFFIKAACILPIFAPPTCAILGLVWINFLSVYLLPTRCAATQTIASMGGGIANTQVSSHSLNERPQYPMYDHIASKLERGENIILDGGTGTDIQRRGAPMSGDTWCAEVNMTHPHIVRAVHQDYIAVGADVITANTFATSALLFNALGRDDELLTIDRAAVAIAREACEGKQVAVAGSMSTMRPVVAGSDRTAKQQEWSEPTARALFERKASNLAAAGVDFILMEMMRDVRYSLWATQAALATGLPVWVGIATERRADGELVGFSHHDELLDDVVRVLAATSPAHISIMHSSPNDTGDAMSIVKRHWAGPLGAYPESGYFKMPEWEFVDIISPGNLVDKAQGWRRLGVTAFGGCCGLGPDHIAALARHFKAA